MRNELFCVLAALLLAGCGSKDTPGDTEDPEDPENGRFVQNGKADTNGIEDHGFAAQCVLNLANRATEDELDDDVGLFGYSASAMVESRPFDHVEQVDDVPFVGWLSFSRMINYARENGHCPTIGEEYAPPGELQAAEDVRGIIENELSHRYPDGELMRRDAHPKAHGCVKAFVTVDNDELPAHLRVGAFADAGREYPAWIRFSNSDIDLNADAEGDARGMAIKMMGVGGQKLLDEHDADTKDIIMINHPVFAVRDALDYVEFAEHGLSGNVLSLLFNVILDLDPTEIKLREMLIGLEIMKIKIANPLYTQYHSMVPYSLGSDEAVKYTAIPCESPDLPIPRNPDDFLRQALSRTLGGDEACFTLAVQRQLDAETMPIEDSTVEWRTEESPFLKVADIRIPQQSFDTPEQNEFCENLSFNPWHTTAEHRPLGGMNRVRKEVYGAISRFRHQHNGAERREPTGHDDQF